MLEQSLSFLEQIEPRNDYWRCYIRDRAPETQEMIDELRHFASRCSGKIADNCIAQADGAQRRLDTVLAKVAPSAGAVEEK